MPGEPLSVTLAKRHEALANRLEGLTRTPARILPACGALLFARPLDRNDAARLQPAFSLLPEQTDSYRILRLPEGDSSVATRRWSLPLKPAAARTPVGIIDTAINGSHPELQAAIVGRRLRIQQRLTDDAYHPLMDHGTQITSLLLGQHTGLAREQSVLFEGVATTTDRGRGVLPAGHLLLAFERLAHAGVCIVNLSLSLGRERGINDALTRLATELGLLTICPWTSREEEPASSAAVLRVVRGDPAPGTYPVGPAPRWRTPRLDPAQIMAPGSRHATAHGQSTVSLDGGASFASLAVTATAARLLGHQPALAHRPAGLTNAFLRSSCVERNGQPWLAVDQIPTV